MHSFPSSKCGPYTLSLLFIQTSNKNIFGPFTNWNLCVLQVRRQSDLFQLPFLKEVFSKCGL